MTTLGKRKRIRFGTWNVQTLFQVGRLAQAGKIMDSYSLDFLGMSEVRWNQCGQISTVNGHLMLWSGMPNEDDVHQYGVGILINRRIRQSVMTYRFINERMMVIRFKGKSRNLSVLQCYAPTEDADIVVKEAFYDAVQNTLDEIPKDDLTILMGDFNAKVGSDNDAIEHVIGRHGVGEMNENGELLVECCGLNSFKIGGTLFPHKLCHKVTWVSPDQRTENQIDHICISAKWSNCLTDVRNKRGADIGSDHHLLFGSLRFPMKKVPRKRTTTRKKYDTCKLKSETTRAAFCTKLHQRMASEDDTLSNVQVAWDHFKNAVLSTCEEVLGEAANRRQDFISTDTWSLIDRRKEAKDQINAARDSDSRIQARQRYSALDRRVKREIRNDKREHINSLASQAEAAAAVYNMKDLYDITKRIANTGRRSNVPVKDRNGTLLTNVDDQLRRWREHFQEVMNLRRDGIEVPQTQASRTLPIRTSPPTRKEIFDALKSLKNGKAAGVDSITAEVLKADINFFADTLRPLFTQIWDTESFPNDWMEGIIVKLPKKGDLTDCNNWRGIIILCIVLKVFCKVILDRIMGPIDKTLRKEQAGFRAGRSCVDQINTLRIIIEQSVEMRSPLYLLFVDYEKAFDSLDRECMWALMRNVGMPDKIIRLIRSSYEGFSCRVLHDSSLSDPFVTVSGVRQGCLLSPLLFLIVMDAVAKAATQDKPRGIVWDPLNPSVRLESLDYADDKCELSHRHSHMQQKLDDLHAQSIKVGMRINVKKTMEMRINAETNAPLTLEQNPIQQVSEFQYLGSVVSVDGGAAKDVLTRIRKARGAFTTLNRIWSSTVYSNTVKLNIFRSCVISVLLYGCETWLVTEDIKRRLQVFVNRCLRRIFRIFWPNTIRNEELLRRANMQNINIEIRRRKFGWLGHTLRKDHTEVCHRALVYNPQGSRSRGRPRNSWRRSTLAEANENSEVRFNNLYDLKPIAARRTRWRHFVVSRCSI